MCGIVWYICEKQAKPILNEGLLRLEYRGYDSAGIATIEKDGIKNIKNKGRVNALFEVNGIDALQGTVGIAHTRWATHGKPCSVNSHPHMDNSKTFAVVHNGIIENYADFRDFLKSRHYEFFSETDTEVIPNLIHYYYNHSDNTTSSTSEKKFLQAVTDACKMLKGSYAIAVLCSDYPDNMIVVRQDSPLVIGKGNKENYISSDIPAILPFTKEFYFLNDKEFALLTKESIMFYDENLQTIQKKIHTITWDSGSVEKDGYPDFMLKEIFEQPKSVKATIGNKFQKSKTMIGDLNLSKAYLSSINKIFIVACGTAMHAGLAGKNLLENLCQIPSEVDVASEFRYRDPIINNQTLCIFISQSGETADTIAALKLAKAKGSKTIAISNVIGSSITREADYTIYTYAGPEIAVASTKAYTSQITLLAILAIYFAEILEIHQDKIEELKTDIQLLPKKIETILKNTSQIENFAKKIHKEKDIFFIGRGIDETVALEGSLKLKEISYIHSEAYPSGELKHGPIALVENGITVVSIMTNRLLLEKSISNVQEVVTRGAKTFIITNQDMNYDFDEVIMIPKTNTLISPILSVIPLQLLAYYIAKEKNLDVDKPRNLAKSVTVE